MNIKSVLALTALALGTGLVHASEATQFSGNASALSRDSVRAELARARDAGELHSRGESYGGFADTPSNRPGLTREAVIAELQRARANGDLAHAGDSYGSFAAAEFRSTRSRAEVRAEALGGGLSRGNYQYVGG